jgi:hypothetical protein
LKRNPAVVATLSFTKKLFDNPPLNSVQKTAPIANREQQKSTAEGRKCSQLFSVEHEGGGGKSPPETEQFSPAYQNEAIANLRP